MVGTDTSGGAGGEGREPATVPPAPDADQDPPPDGDGEDRGGPGHTGLGGAAGGVTVEEVAAAVDAGGAGGGTGGATVVEMVQPAEVRRPGFFDPRDPGSPLEEIVLCRLDVGGETFRLDRPIGYWDADLGGIVVPADLGSFRTDLTSVPRFFTWLIPVTGEHLPAALLHDGLVPNRTGPPDYVAATEIDRVTADRVFRDAMGDLGTSWARRWLIWAAVATATMVTGSWRQTAAARLALAATVLAVIVGGTLATMDLVDCRAPIPWMADRPAWLEVLYGAIGAVVIPLVLSVLWWRRWAAGVIAGVALALLVHVTLAIVLVYALFSTVDRGIEGDVRRAAAWLALAVAIVAGTVSLAIWAC
jgi:Protein of unknown function (DUF1353)